MTARGRRLVMVNLQAGEPDEFGLNPKQWHGCWFNLISKQCQECNELL